MGQKSIPQPKRLQHIDRAFEQRRGARVEGTWRARRRRQADQRDGSSAMGKRERRGDPRRPSSDHDNVDVLRFSQDVLSVIQIGSGIWQRAG
jgi:hypothetical protein